MPTQAAAARVPPASSNDDDDVPVLVDRSGSASRETESATSIASTSKSKSKSKKRPRVSLSPPKATQPKTTPRTKKIRKDVVDELARELMAIIDGKKRKETYMASKMFIEAAQRKYPWVTRDKIYGR